MPWTNRRPRQGGYYFARPGVGSQAQVVEFVPRAGWGEIYQSGSRSSVASDEWEWWCREEGDEPEPIEVPF